MNKSLDVKNLESVTDTHLHVNGFRNDLFLSTLLCGKTSLNHLCFYFFNVCVLVSNGENISNNLKLKKSCIRYFSTNNNPDLVKTLGM